MMEIVIVDVQIGGWGVQYKSSFSHPKGGMLSQGNGRIGKARVHLSSLLHSTCPSLN